MVSICSCTNCWSETILDEIAKTLIEKEKITGLEMLELIKNTKPELISA
jgi:hypothetical protein